MKHLISSIREASSQFLLHEELSNGYMVRS